MDSAFVFVTTVCSHTRTHSLAHTQAQDTRIDRLYVLFCTGASRPCVGRLPPPYPYPFPFLLVFVLTLLQVLWFWNTVRTMCRCLYKCVCSQLPMCVWVHAHACVLLGGSSLFLFCLLCTELYQLKAHLNLSINRLFWMPHPPLTKPVLCMWLLGKKKTKTRPIYISLISIYYFILLII